MLSVYGKVSHQYMDKIFSDFAARPETAALISPEKQPNNINEPFYEPGNNKGDEQVMILEEVNESEYGEEEKRLEGLSKYKSDSDSDNFDIKPKKLKNKNGKCVTGKTTDFELDSE